MRLTLLVVLLSLVFSSIVSVVASAHTQGINSVNQNKELLYFDDTSRDGALDYAVQAWSQLNTDNRGITIREVKDKSQATVIVTDKDTTEKDMCGQSYSYYGAVDYIYLDKTWFSNHNKTEKRQCVMHELGHHLGFAHNDLQDTSIMYPCPTCTDLTAPGPHDVADYYAAWILDTAIPYG